MSKDLKDLEAQLELAHGFHEIAVKERNHERTRVYELEKELASANHCWKECSDRLDWLEDRMAPENAGKSFVIELCDDYRDRFFEIEEECIQSPSNGRSRPAKTARVKK